MAVGAPIAAPAIAQAAPEIRWRMTSSFPKSARRALQRRPNAVPLRRRGDRQQIPDPMLFRRRAGDQPPGPRCGVDRRGRMRAHAARFSRQQGPHAGVRRRRSLRPQRASASIVVGIRRRRGPRQRVAQEVQGLRHPGRLHGRADGRLVQARDHIARRHQGPALPHQRHGRSDLGSARNGGVPTCRTPTSCRHWRMAYDRRRGVHLPARRRAAGAGEDGKVQPLPVLVGKQRHDAPGRQSGEVERPAASLPGGR